MFARRVISLWEFLWDKLSRFLAFAFIKCLQLAPFVLGGGSIVGLSLALQPLRKSLLADDERWWKVASSWMLLVGAIFLLYAILRFVHQLSNGGVTLVLGWLTRKKLTERGFSVFSVALWSWWGTVSLVLSLMATWQLESGMLTFVSLLVFNLAGAPLPQLEKCEEWRLTQSDEAEDHSGKSLHRARMGDIDSRVEALKARARERMAARAVEREPAARIDELEEDDSNDFEELWAKTESRRAVEDEPEGDADWNSLPR